MNIRMENAVPEGFRPLKGDASGRRYFRGDEGILVVYPESMSEAFENFLFWRERYHSVGLPVPSVLELHPGKHRMLIEDWGDCDGVAYVDGLDSGGRREFVEAVMELCRTVPRMADGVAEFRLPPVPVEDELAFMLEHTSDTLFSGRDLRWLEGLCREICEKLDRLPDELAHRDFHLRNVLVRNQHLCIIDFQDTRLAPTGYDLASLLFDNYADLSDLARDLFDGLDDPAFRWVALQRNLKALGTFVYFGLKRGKNWFRESIRPAMNHVLDHLVVLSRSNDADEWGKLVRSVEPFIPADD